MSAKNKLLESQDISERKSKILKFSIEQVLDLNIFNAKHNAILRLFIGLVQTESPLEFQKCSEEDCLAVLNWLSSENIDVNKPNWHKTDEGKLIPQLLVDENSDNYEISCCVQALRYMLSILINCIGNIHYTDENGKSILHIFLEDHLRSYEMTRVIEYQGYQSINHIFLEDHLRSHEMTMPRVKEYQIVKYLISEGISVDAADKCGDTPLFIAAYRMEISFIELFLETCMNINACNQQGDTLLHIILKSSDTKMNEFRTENRMLLIQLLLLKGANVNLKNKNGWTPLHLTVKRKTPLLKILIGVGADVNAQDLDGSTPLHLAALYGNYYATEHLVRKGADVSRRDKIFGFTALHMAALHYERNNFEILLKHTLDVNDGGNYGITALHLAVFDSNLVFLELLIAHGANVHCRDIMTHSTALHFVAKKGGIIDYISDIGNVQNKPNWKPYVLCQGDPEPLVELLLQNGLDINAKDIRGRTPLLLATDYIEPPDYETEVFVGYSRVCHVNTLLMFGAYVDFQDNEGNMPINHALKFDYERAVDSLIEFGVDLDDADTIRIVLSLNSDESIVRDTILWHMIKLKMADLPVSDAYNEHLDDPNLPDYHDECWAELNRMKNTSIDVDVSIYDFLHMDCKRRLTFTRQICTNVKNKFRFYRHIILSKCREAEQRKLLIELAKSAWYQITEIYLPDICVERILDYLKNRFLRILVDGALSDLK